jgi:hypothetical protein
VLFGVALDRIARPRHLTIEVVSQDVLYILAMLDKQSKATLTHHYPANVMAIQGRDDFMASVVLHSNRRGLTFITVVTFLWSCFHGTPLEKIGLHGRVLLYLLLSHRRVPTRGRSSRLSLWLFELTSNKLK